MIYSAAQEGSRTRISRRQGAHHDALEFSNGKLEFPNGEIVLLIRLYEGQHATVLQLPAQPKTPVEADAQTRVVHVG